jgi:hypothetical protein
MMAPVQFTCGLASETVPPIGLALRVVGMPTIASTARDKQNTAASGYLDCLNAVMVRSLVSLLNISGSPFCPTAVPDYFTRSLRYY